MKVTIFTSSNNKDGLTAACGNAALQGANEEGTEVVQIDLNEYSIGKCNACGTGLGPCFEDHMCHTRDDFQDIHLKIADSDAYIIITPVYWGEMSESAKAFFDRLRRCEAFKEMLNGESIMHEKPVVGIAAAGGTGRGTISCLESLERFFNQMNANIFDLISITRKSKQYKMETIRACAKEMVLNGSTVVFSMDSYEKPDITSNK